MNKGILPATGIVLGKIDTVAVSVAAVSAFLIVALSAGEAAAAKPRVGVARLAGTGEGPVRASVLKAIKAAGYLIVGGEPIESAAAKAGASLDSDDGWRAVARELGVSAFVTGEITRKKASLVVRNGADGAVIGEGTFPGADAKKIAAAVAAGFWKQLGPAIKRGRPPSGAKARSDVAEETEPAGGAADDGASAAGASAGAGSAADEPPPPPPEKPKQATKHPARPAAVAEGDATEDKRGDDDDGQGEAAVKPRKKTKKKEASKDKATTKKHEGESSDEDEEGEILPVALELGVGGRALFRTVDWNQDVARRFGPYALKPGPEASLWLEVFPASFFGGGFAAKLGLFGGFTRGFGVTSMTKSGSTLATTFQDFTIGGKMRFSLGALSPYASAAYSQQTFKLGSGSAAVPNFDYKIVRLGAGARVAFTPSAFAEVGAAFLLATDVGSQAGEIGSKDFFPNAKAYGVDAGASFGLRVLGPLAARIGADFRQLGLDFHVRPGDTSPAVGGATDRYITIWGGIAVILDGQPRDSGDDEEEPAAAEAPAAEADGAETE